MDLLLDIENIDYKTILHRLTTQQVFLGGRQLACARHSHQSEHLYAPHGRPDPANSDAWHKGGGFVQANRARCANYSSVRYHTYGALGRADKKAISREAPAGCRMPLVCRPHRRGTQQGEQKHLI